MWQVGNTHRRSTAGSQGWPAVKLARRIGCAADTGGRTGLVRLCDSPPPLLNTPVAAVGPPTAGTRLAEGSAAAPACRCAPWHVQQPVTNAALQASCDLQHLFLAGPAPCSSPAPPPSWRPYSGRQLSACAPACRCSTAACRCSADMACGSRPPWRPATRRCRAAGTVPPLARSPAPPASGRGCTGSRSSRRCLQARTDHAEPAPDALRRLCQAGSPPPKCCVQSAEGGPAPGVLLRSARAAAGQQHRPVSQLHLGDRASGRLLAVQPAAEAA